MITNPAVLLVCGVVVIAAATIIFWPIHGLIWRMWPRLRLRRRIAIEDALKHFYDCHEKHIAGTLISLSGALQFSGDRTSTLLTRMLELGLIENAGGTYQLTDTGRQEALRVIRIHRLWERYLSEETGVDANHWHQIADRKEHSTTEQEAKALSMQLQNPPYDPHGDPIPSADGEVARLGGTPLTEYAAGKIVKIVHVEDEPGSVYQQINALGLQLGSELRVLDTSPSEIKIAIGRNELKVTPVVAANLWVKPIDEALSPFIEDDQLTDLVPGEQARVTGIAPAYRGIARRRLFDLGFLPGTLVQAEFSSASGDPTAYRVRGALIALRREQAAQIFVRRLTAEVTT